MSGDSNIGNTDYLILLTIQCVCGFFSQVIFGITGFGGGLIFQIVWYVCTITSAGRICNGDLTQSVIDIALIGMIVQAIQMVHMRQHCEWGIFFAAFPGMVVGNLIGMVILFSADSFAFLTQVMGGIFLFVSLYKIGIELWEVRKEKGERKPLVSDITMEQEDREGNNASQLGVFKINFSNGAWITSKFFWATAICGLIAGLLSGTFACGGPPWLVYVLIYQMPKDTWRGSGACIFILAPLMRVAFSLAIGEYYLFGGICSILLLPACGVLGLIVGNMFAPYVNQTVFRRSIMCLLLLISCSMACGGPTLLALYLLLAIVICLTIILQLCM